MHDTGALASVLPSAQAASSGWASLTMTATTRRWHVTFVARPYECLLLKRVQLETVLLRHRPREVVWPKDAAGLPMLSKPALKVHALSAAYSFFDDCFRTVCVW